MPPPPFLKTPEGDTNVLTSLPKYLYARIDPMGDALRVVVNMTEVRTYDWFG